MAGYVFFTGVEAGTCPLSAFTGTLAIISGLPTIRQMNDGKPVA
jgi:hypothetical protein